MRIGIMTGVRRESLSIDSMVRESIQAEGDGFDTIWFAQPATHGYEALTLISLAGRQTSRIELGTAVVPTYPRHPMVMAQHALTAQAASNGRLALGIGVAHKPTIEGIMGLSYSTPAKHMREYLMVLRLLASGQAVDFKGEEFRIEAQLEPPVDSSSFQVLTAALAPRMLRIAGEMADGTITWMAGPKTIATHIIPLISQAASASGRPQPRICVGLPVSVTDDPKNARQNALGVYQRYGQLPNYKRLLDIEGVESATEVIVIGNEGQVEESLRGFASAGATDFMAQPFPVGDDPEGSVARTWACLKNLVGKIG